jgi:hypothetical protein
MTNRIDTSGDDHAVASWIWRNLVPKSGQSATVQGELLRAIEKLRWEAQRNGNINWDEGFVTLINYLESTLLAEPMFSAADRIAIEADLIRLRDEEQPYVEDDLYDRLTAAVVRFARAKSELIARAKDPSLHR